MGAASEVIVVIVVLAVVAMALMVNSSSNGVKEVEKAVPATRCNVSIIELVGDP